MLSHASAPAAGSKSGTCLLLELMLRILRCCLTANARTYLRCPHASPAYVRREAAHAIASHSRDTNCCLASCLQCVISKGIICTFQVILNSDESGWQGRLLGICKPFLTDVAAAAVALAPGCDPAVAANAARITTELSREEAKFAQTLETGVSAHAKLVYNHVCGSTLAEVLNCYQPHRGNWPITSISATPQQAAHPPRGRLSLARAP